MTVNPKQNNQSVNHCTKCGQELPILDKETQRKFKVMCDLWIASLLENKK